MASTDGMLVDLDELNALPGMSENLPQDFERVGNEAEA